MPENWENKHYSFFQNKECEYFPCHKGISEDSFNCLFCYCPLYLSGRKCGGNFNYTKSGVKDCTGCTIPHAKGNYGYMLERFRELISAMKEQEQAAHEQNKD